MSNHSRPPAEVSERLVSSFSWLDVLGRGRDLGQRLRDRGLHQRIRALVDHLVQHVVQRLPLDQVHGVEVVAVVFPDGVHRHDVGVMQLGGRAGLTLETLSGLAGQAQGGWQDLQRDTTVE